MTEEPVEPGARPSLAALHEWLAAAAPEARTELILGLIVESPGGRLELPPCEGNPAVLDGIALGRATLARRVAAEEAPPAWWDSLARRVRLQAADLAGVRLRGADLRGADLRDANLRGASLGDSDLRGALMEKCQLQDADLAGVNLRGAALGNSACQGVMLEDADLTGATLRFADLSDAALEKATLRRADLWGADLRKANLAGADLRDAVIKEVNLRGAVLLAADLRRADLGKSDLQGAALDGADLRGANLTGADLTGASLKDAKLQEVDLSRTILTHVHLRGARLDGTRFQKSQLGGAIGEDRAGLFEDARKGYLVLERAFTDLGDPDAASWAYRRRRRMQKRAAWREARDAWRSGRYGAALRAVAMAASDQLAEWVCDYGESIPRVLGALFVVYTAFILVYAATGSVVREGEGPAGATRTPTRNPIDLAIFSLHALTTGNIGFRFLPTNDLALSLVGVQAFFGIALIGLLGFVLGNRIRR